MQKETIGIIGQYSACLLMASGLAYELAAGESLGWWVFSAGCLVTVIATKIRGK